VELALPSQIGEATGILPVEHANQGKSYRMIEDRAESFVHDFPAVVVRDGGGGSTCTCLRVVTSARLSRLLTTNSRGSATISHNMGLVEKASLDERGGNVALYERFMRVNMASLSQLIPLLLAVWLLVDRLLLVEYTYSMMKRNRKMAIV